MTMEEQRQQQQKMKKRTRRITKKKKKRKSLYQKTIFHLLLASLCSKSNTRKTLIKKCLKKLSLSLPHAHLPAILALLPSLLQSNCAEIVCKSVEIIGAASLASFEMNGMIVAEDGVMKGLILLLGSSKRRVAVGAGNAVLDLSTTLVGRQRLIEFDAVGKLIYCFIQESKSLDATVCFNDDMKFLEEDDYLKLLLQGAISLINSCTIEHLQHIPKELSEKFSLLLKRLWGKAHKQRQCRNSSRCDPENEFCISNIKTNSLVESIFRLSIDYDLYSDSIDFKHVMESIFDLGEASMGPFLSESWETSPMLIKNGSKASLMKDGIFDPFIKYLGLKQAIIPPFLPSILKSIISCPSIESDELDILKVIKEIKNHLGYPIIYHQDIRVVKTQYGERELHYFQGKSGSEPVIAPHILSINDILKCEEAYKEGYSIALRGMEFRYQMIAAIADELASLFGQPSAGANMYLTPSNSQGLARHSDDHCVFVCQLIGVKRWKVFPRPDLQLPRLYEPCNSLHDLEDEKCVKIDGCQQFMLKEGDVLYVPRGFPHEAIAESGDDENVNPGKFSLHLTLAIEIEPPFEWEGFMHVALYCWDQKHKASHHNSNDSLQCALHSVSVELLHFAIKLIGNINPEFRKACLVGATSSSPDIRDRLCKNQLATFKFLISKIASESKYSDVVEHFEVALKKNEYPFECMGWMKWLTDGEEIEREQHSLSIYELLIRHRDTVEAGFLQVKSKFCLEVEFQDVERLYLVLLEKYRKVRKRYTNGMLSLHSAVYNEE